MISHGTSMNPSTASLRSLALQSSNDNTGRFFGAICLVSILCNLALFISAQAAAWAFVAVNLLSIGSVWLIHERSRRVIRLAPRELAECMLQVQESERQRLSRELHDDIGQMLTAARLQFDHLQRRLPVDCHEPCRRLGETLEETLDKVRDLSAILNPRQLHSLGLEASLRMHLVRNLADNPVRWTLECNQSLNGLPNDMAMAAFRIAQEAVTNMLRHAQASNLVVRLKRLAEGLSLEIHDDGKGFELPGNPVDLGLRGLAGMHERATLQGGTWNLETTPGRGTRISVLLPWPPRSQKRACSDKT